MKTIETEVFAQVPARLRKSGSPPERLAAGKSATPMGSFLEGPAFDRAGNLYVTDLADPTGCVYRYSAAGKLEQLANCLASPNGIVVDQNLVYVAVTRANAAWRLPLTPEGKVVRLGVFLHLSGGRGPDGMAMDEAGGLAVAHIDFGALWIFSQRGEALYRVASCKSDMLTNLAYQGNEMYISDSGSGCILRARVPTAGRTLFSHL